MTLLTLDVFFALCGVFLAVLAGRIACTRGHPARWGSAMFWGLLAVIFVGGKNLPPTAVGYAIVVMVGLAALKQVVPPKFAAREAVALEADAVRLGNRLLTPVLVVPAVAVIGGFFFGDVAWGGVRLVEAKAVSQIALGVGCVLALGLALRMTRARPVVAVDEGGRLLQMISSTLILPQMLAALGGIFAKAGVGDVIAQLVARGLPVEHSALVAVVAYCAGMAGFTILMGNAFAAFPIMTLGVGLPFVVKTHGGDPAIMGTLGMLSGYCGTLVTPMAANFNLVPVRLLELRDDFAVIKAQLPFAVAIWSFNVVVMYLCVYRF